MAPSLLSENQEEEEEEEEEGWRNGGDFTPSEDERIEQRQSSRWYDAKYVFLRRRKQQRILQKWRSRILEKKCSRLFGMCYLHCQQL